LKIIFGDLEDINGKIMINMMGFGIMVK